VKLNLICADDYGSVLQPFKYFTLDIEGDIGDSLHAKCIIDKNTNLEFAMNVDDVPIVKNSQIADKGVTYYRD